MKIDRLLRICLVMCVLAAFPRPAYAYLDPGTGGMLLSALVSLVLTTGLAVQAYWYKLVAFFRGSRPGEGERSEGADPGDSQAEASRDSTSGA